MRSSLATRPPPETEDFIFVGVAFPQARQMHHHRSRRRRSSDTCRAVHKTAGYVAPPGPSRRFATRARAITGRRRRTDPMLDRRSSRHRRSSCNGAPPQRPPALTVIPKPRDGRRNGYPPACPKDCPSPSYRFALAGAFFNPRSIFSIENRKAESLLTRRSIKLKAWMTVE
jgi:hypothetical protein